MSLYVLSAIDALADTAQLTEWLLTNFIGLFRLYHFIGGIDDSDIQTFQFFPVNYKMCNS